ncbi:GNAT family N-acetyltransferase [Streptomyces sp. NPDC001941]|uniref:GNAT family N-acetyltransferase n=1 Tax=Streptomyces sp. NPDC001941 TaxID=3154659 RepID=UPI0033200E07
MTPATPATAGTTTSVQHADPDRATHLLVDEALPADWPDRTFLTSPAWLAMMGDRPPGRGLFFRLTRGGRTLAATTGYLVEDPDCYESFNPHDLLWRDPPVFPDQPPPTGPAPERTASFPCLVLVQPGYDCAVLTEGPPDTAAHRVRELLDAVTDWARRAGAVRAAVLYASGAALTRALDDAPAWHRHPGTVRSVLDLPEGVSGADGFDAYVAGLTKTSRQKVRWDLRDLSRAGVRTALADAAAPGDHEVALRMNLIGKYGGYSHRDVERARLDRLLALYPPDRFRLFHCTSARGDVVGFSLFLTHHDQWHVFWCGFDYADPASRGTYFDAMFYAPVRAALAEGVRSIDYGLGYERSKKWRGCHGARRDLWTTDLTDSAPGPRREPPTRREPGGRAPHPDSPSDQHRLEHG